MINKTTSKEEHPPNGQDKEKWRAGSEPETASAKLAPSKLARKTSECQTVLRTQSDGGKQAPLSAELQKLSRFRTMSLKGSRLAHRLFGAPDE